LETHLSIRRLLTVMVQLEKASVTDACDSEMQTERKEQVEMYQISEKFTNRIKSSMVVHLLVVRELVQSIIRICSESNQNPTHKGQVEESRSGQKKCNKDNNNSNKHSQIFNNSYQQAY
jgi:hypothetical protein